MNDAIRKNTLKRIIPQNINLSVMYIKERYNASGSRRAQAQIQQDISKKGIKNG